MPRQPRSWPVTGSENAPGQITLLQITLSQSLQSGLNVAWRHTLLHHCRTDQGIASRLVGSAWESRACCTAERVRVEIRAKSRASRRAAAPLATISSL